MIDQVMQNPAQSIPFTIVAFILSFCVHEFFHAFVANKLGDPTAKNLGRVTLNPLAHMDPVGTVLPIFLLLFGSPFVFGWGKPVPFNPMYFKKPKRDTALVSLAGPGSNILLAVLASLIIKIVGINSLLGVFLYFLAVYSLVLGFFNLIPLGPLDGTKIVYGFLPLNLAIQWQEIQRYGMFILLFLIFTNVTSSILSPLLVISMKILGL
jgi:Zn-dependent protease